MSVEDYKTGKAVRMGRFFDQPKPWELDQGDAIDRTANVGRASLAFRKKYNQTAPESEMFDMVHHMGTQVQELTRAMGLLRLGLKNKPVLNWYFKLCLQPHSVEQCILQNNIYYFLIFISEVGVEEDLKYDVCNYFYFSLFLVLFT